MNLGDAITAVETKSSAFQAASTTTTNDQSNVDSIQQKLTAAQAQVTQDQQAQDAAAQAFNSALDDLVQAAQAAKVQTSGQAATEVAQ